MELTLLNTNFIPEVVVDTFESLIWTERYCQCGDFELYLSMNQSNLSLLQEDYYLMLKDSYCTMIIEGIQIDTDPEKGNHLIITGRSLEFILDRRIIWGQTILSGSLQNGIQQLLNENAINPVVVARKIDNLIFIPSTDPRITELTIDTQYNGDNLYTVICEICHANNIGFKIVLTEDNLFAFYLYMGEDRSYDQLVNPHVVFSPKFENLLSTNYVESKKALKNVALVAGEGEGINRVLLTVENSPGGEIGLSRREIFTDAKNISSAVDGGTLTEEEYYSQLAQKGFEDLSKNTFISSFEGNVDTTFTYKYGIDFFMGDILQIENEYGLQAKTRVTELIQSQNSSGISIYPTFTKIA